MTKIISTDPDYGVTYGFGTNLGKGVFTPEAGFGNKKTTTTSSPTGFNIASNLNNNVNSFADIGNPFKDYLPQEFLETSPSAAYFSSPGATEFYTRPSGQVDPTRKKFYQESFQDIYNEYLGRLGTMAREGEMPDLRFSDYLSSADPFRESFERQTPYQRVISNRAYSPSTRFIYY